MSGRGPRGCRGVGRGRGRGRGKTQIWEWESYTPSAEVYAQLWRVRKEPAIVTARLPNECPIPNARTRILHRWQTDDTIKRERYSVEITHISETEDGHDSVDRTQVKDVDLQCILQFVSPAELERYETEQFRLEAEADAVAIRAEAEELARQQLQKNTKASNTNRGSRMLNGLGLPVGPSTRARGRPRGSRGRGRGRSRRLVLGSRPLADDMREELVDSEPIANLHQNQHVRPPIQTSPGVARSAFVANSALPISPITRRLSTALPQRKHAGFSVSGEEAGLALVSGEAKVPPNAPPNAPVHLRDSLAPKTEVKGEDGDKDHLNTVSSERHSVPPTLLPSTDKISKAATHAAPLPLQAPSPPSVPADMFSQMPLFFDRSSVAASDSDDTIPAQPPSLHHELNEDVNEDVNEDTIHVHTTHPDGCSHEHDQMVDDPDTESADEYVVEAIVNHFQEDGKTYYLVKWDGYEDSHDWLLEEDLEGAADLVAEYKQRVGRKNKKVKLR